jgi:deoxyribonuclease-4
MIPDSPLFGPSGNSPLFYEEGHNSSEQMPPWLAEKGLTAYEYSLTHGVRIKRNTAERIGAAAKETGLFVSVHAPYYINLATADEDGLEKSVRHLERAAEAAGWLGARRVVFHPGSASGVDRAEAFDRIQRGLTIVEERCAPWIEDGIKICPETMGKKNQMGNVDEILALCAGQDWMIPTFDFGHIHAAGGGSLNSVADFEAVFDKIEAALGRERASQIQCHFSRIEYGQSGERRHMNFEDTDYGPDFIHLAQVIVKRNYAPVLICESRGNQVQDAMEMKATYEKLKGDTK